MHLMDETTTPFEFSRSVRKYRKHVGMSPHFSYTIENFRHAQMMCKYKDEL